MTFLMKTVWLRVCLLGCMALVVQPSNGRAQLQSQALDLDAISQVSIIDGWRTDDGAVMAAVVFDLAPDWKTYWRAADADGIPPSFDWSGSDNLQSITYHWPTPDVVRDGDTISVGFKNRLVLPVLLVPNDPDQPLSLSLIVDYGVCREICIPARAVVSANVSGEGSSATSIHAWLDRMPRRDQQSGLTSARCQILPANQDYIVRASLDFAQSPGDLHIVITESGSDDLWISRTDHAVTGNTVSLEADMMHFGDGPMMFDRSKLRITLLTSTGGIEVNGCTSG